MRGEYARSAACGSAPETGSKNVAAKKRSALRTARTGTTARGTVPGRRPAVPDRSSDRAARFDCCGAVTMQAGGRKIVL
jgi:hypothetical protein